jgi:hypothetical protein
MKTRVPLTKKPRQFALLWKTRSLPTWIAPGIDGAVRKNARYSLPAFAAFLGTDHSTLQQILRGTRRAPAGYIAKEHVPDAQADFRAESGRTGGEAADPADDAAGGDEIAVLHDPQGCLLPCGGEGD